KSSKIFATNKKCLKTIKMVVTILVSAKANETRLNNLILLYSIFVSILIKTTIYYRRGLKEMNTVVN
ncbi:MAG: hypothetical protein O4965_02380, partial [Trichodesmium sp. St19_bin1]|nr:hypothetical protein [Trichodesmium sp. St19_bin1]